jgi:hypothetical protein
MTQRVPLFTILAGLVTAAAWWVSRGVLDLAVVDGQTVRVAHLPGWEALLGFLVAATAFIGLASAAQPARGNAARADARWLPLLALAVLGLPYVPILADTFPSVMLLAGPLRSAVWTVVLGMLAWSLMLAPSAPRWLPARWEATLPHLTTPAIVLMATAALATGTQVDGISPITPLDLGVRLTLLATMSWATLTMATRATGEAGAAGLSTAAVLLSVPSLQTLSTGGGPLAVMTLVAIAAGVRLPVLAGLACGLLTWFGADVIPLAMVVLLGRIASTSLTASARTPDLAALTALVIPFLGASLARAMGVVTVSAPWGPVGDLPVLPIGGTMTAGLLGWLFDQRHGLLVWVPTLWVAVPGMRALWRRDAVARTQVVTAVIASMALAAMVARHTEWWGSDDAQRWPMAALLPLLAPLVAAGWTVAPPLSAARAVRPALLWLGLWMSAVVLWSDAGTSSLRGLPGLSPLLVWASPLTEAWRALPTFRHDSVTIALLHTAIWGGATVGASMVLRRLRSGPLALEATRALASIAATVAAAATMVMLWPHDERLSGPPPFARSRRLSLEAFDPRARPAGLLYTPLTRLASTETLPLLGLEVTPGLRNEPQPLRVLLNGRWSLPAGHYRIELEWRPDGLPSAETVGLQVGRTGPPLTTMDIGGDSGRAAFDLTLPSDAVFVGLRGSPRLEHALARIRVTPLSVVPASLRLPTPQVVGATHTPGGLVLVHTDTAGIEAGSGVWIMAGPPSLLSLAEAPSASGTGPSPAITVRLRSEAPTNQVTLTSRGWAQTVTLAAGIPLDVQVPRTGAALTPLTISAATAYVPASHMPGSEDRRPLGVWVTRPATADTAVH